MMNIARPIIKLKKFVGVWKKDDILQVYISFKTWRSSNTEDGGSENGFF